MADLTRDQCCYQVHAAIRRVTGDTVSFGPFSGMRMSRFSHPYYLLGTYERELHPVLGKLKEKRFDRIINVGAGDGYYAVGLVLNRPCCHVEAFELRAEATPGLAALAKANGISSGRFQLHGKCGQVELGRCIHDDCATLIFMDCEGDEEILLASVHVPGLSRCHIIVELHEFVYKGIVEEIRGRFSGTHDITEVWSLPRKIEDLPFTPEPGDFTEELKPFYVQTIDENRPVDMPWFYMEPKNDHH